MSVDLSSDPAQALLLKPHAGPAVAGIARIEENNAGMVERFLNCSECAGTRIGPTALQFFTATSERPAALASWACVQLRNPRAARICPGVIILIR